MPKVSVCIPAYNQPALLKKAIDSVLCQRFTDYEIIITDDSPGTAVADLVATYNAQQPIFYYKNSTQIGSPGNWNECISKASGEYIKILHHDDYLYNVDSLGLFAAMLDENPEADFAFSASRSEWANGNRKHGISPAQLNALKQNPLVLYSGNIIGGPSATILRKNTGLMYDERLKWLVDIEYYIRQISANNHICYCDKDLVATFAAEGRITDICEGVREVEIDEHFYLLEKISDNRNRFTSRAVRNCIVHAINLCKKFRINQVQDLRNCGFNGRVNNQVKLFLALNKFATPLARIYFKTLRSL